MPVLCHYQIEPLSTEAFRELDYRVMRHAFESQNDLGRLADERIYQADLASRLRQDVLEVVCELEIQLSYLDFIKPLYIDMVADRNGIYELKVAKAISDAHVGQLLTYLLLLDLPRGKIVNFGSTKVESRFVNAPLSYEQRRDFRFDDSNYFGDHHFRDLALGLLRDWGTSLTISLYAEALEFQLRKLSPVEVMLPLQRNGQFLGNQRFLLASPDTAFKLTALTQELTAFRDQIGRLIRYSPLRSIHWLNIHHEVVCLTTIIRDG
jgi:GxxExxY protein